MIMKCPEIQERFVDLLYDEGGISSGDPELKEHIRSCSDCQKELAGLQSVRKMLSSWDEEPLLRPIQIPASVPVRRIPYWAPWNLVRYAAFAVLLVLAFLGLTNADIQWNQNGFSFQTHLLGGRSGNASASFTKEESVELIRRAMEDSHQLNYQMIQNALDYVDNQRQQDIRYLKDRLKEARAKN
jgi:hypothetical protein